MEVAVAETASIEEQPIHSIEKFDKETQGLP
jgi:hypothetical protein